MKKKTKKLCSGCKDNFYNGNNPLGVEECWSFENAQVVKKKFVPMSQRPPWNMPAVTTLSCHRKTGYAAVGENQTK